MRQILTRRLRGVAARWLVVAVLAVLTAGCGGGGGGAGTAGGQVGGGGAGGGAGGGGGGTGGGLPAGTTFEARLLAGGLLRGVWGTASDDLFGVGGGGLLAHYDGTQWTPFDPPGGFDRDLHGVFGFSSTDVYAVGDSGVILHFDGTAWTRQQVTPSITATLYAVWGSGPGDVYAAGAGTIVHFDGAAWSRVSDPAMPGADWRGISGSGPDEVLFAGEGGNFQSAHFLHFDGQNWTDVPVPPVAGNTYLSAVWSTGPDEAIAVGVGGRALAWNGVSLQELPRGTNEALNAVWGISPTQIFAVGVRNTFLRYNGATWSDVAFDVGSDSVYSLFGFAGNDLVAAGRGVYHFDGAAFDTLLPFAGAANAWVGSATNALILGEQTLRYDGQKAVPEDFGGLSVPRLTAAWGPPDHIVAVAGNGSAYLYDGMSWGAMTTNNVQGLTDVWGAAPNDVFAVGVNGTILHFNGVAWGAMASGTSEYLSGVWGTSGDNVYAVGANGTIVHFNGNSWAPLTSGVPDFLADVVGFDADSILVAYAGGLLQGNGLTWTPVLVEVDGAPTTVNAIGGTAVDNLFLAASGTPVHFDGATTTRLSSLRLARFVKALGSNAALAGGAGGYFDEMVVVYSAR